MDAPITEPRMQGRAPGSAYHPRAAGIPCFTLGVCSPAVATAQRTDFARMANAAPGLWRDTMLLTRLGHVTW